MNRLIFNISILVLLLSACTPAPPTMDEPVNSETPSPPKIDDFNPKPEDAGLIHGQIYLDSTDLLTLESFPLQFMLSLQGSLPNPCSQLRVIVNPPDAEFKVAVEAYSIIDPAIMCAEVLQPFDVNIPLGGFPAGSYTLWVNGELVAEFQPYSSRLKLPKLAFTNFTKSPTPN